MGNFLGNWWMLLVRVAGWFFLTVMKSRVAANNRKWDEI
jgi:hypothetical protein